MKLGKFLPTDEFPEFIAKHHSYYPQNECHSADERMRRGSKCDLPPSSLRIY